MAKNIGMVPCIARNEVLTPEAARVQRRSCQLPIPCSDQSEVTGFIKSMVCQTGSNSGSLKLN